MLKEVSEYPKGRWFNRPNFNYIRTLPDTLPDGPFNKQDQDLFQKLIDIYSGSEFDYMENKLKFLKDKVHLGRAFAIQGEALECCLEEALEDAEQEYDGYPYHR